MKLVKRESYRIKNYGHNENCIFLRNICSYLINADLERLQCLEYFLKILLERLIHSVKLNFRVNNNSFKVQSLFIKRNLESECHNLKKNYLFQLFNILRYSSEEKKNLTQTRSLCSFCL